jgi:predicted house-cleaning noncanonical NTP pyrophosphatase (MazG superfamily)
MSENTKLTDDELLSVKSLRDEIVNVISSVGQLKLSHDLIEEDLNTAKTKLSEQATKYKELLVNEKELIDTLMKKYGIGSLDLETGVFTPEQ